MPDGLPDGDFCGATVLLLGRAAGGAAGTVPSSAECPTGRPAMRAGRLRPSGVTRSCSRGLGAASEIPNNALRQGCCAILRARGERADILQGEAA